MAHGQKPARLIVRRTARRIRRAAGAVCIIVFLTCVLLEICLRGLGDLAVYAFFKGRFEKARDLEAGDFNILCLGDSYTWGGGSEADYHMIEGYPEQLERLLNRRPRSRPIRILNLGVPGYTSSDVRRLMERFLGTVSTIVPDMCIVATGINNYHPWELRRTLFTKMGHGSLVGHAYLWLTGLKLYRMLYFLGALSPHAEDLYTINEDTLTFKDPRLYTLYRKWLEEDLTEMHALCASRHIELVVLAYHIGFHSYEIQKSFCARHDVPFIDIPRLEKDPLTGRHTFQQASWHPTHAEYSKIARWVAEYLETHQLLPMCSPLNSSLPLLKDTSSGPMQTVADHSK